MAARFCAGNGVGGEGVATGCDSGSTRCCPYLCQVEAVSGKRLGVGKLEVANCDFKRAGRGATRPCLETAMS
jgi:hypothetical protein